MQMNDLYRKSSLERLSSPEQLDQMISVTSPAVWLAFGGGALCLAALLIWSLTAWLPSRVSANGIFLADQNTYPFTSEVNGIVREVRVELGDEVHAGDVLAVLDTTDGQQQLDALNGRLAKVEAVTLESTDDEATSDNLSLLRMKSQLSTLSSDVQQQKVVLDKRKAELEALASQVDAARQARDAARENLFSALPTDSGLAIQLQYQEAQTVYNAAWQTYESLNSSEYQSLVTTGLNLPMTLIEAGQTAKTSSLSALGSIYKTITGVMQYPVMKQRAYDKMVEAKAALDKAQAAYEESNARSVALNNEQSVLNDAYSTASSEYSTIYSRQMSLQEQVNSQELQILSALVGQENSANSYIQQFSDEKAAAIDTLQRQIVQQEQNMDKYTLCASADGSIIDVTVRPGSAVSAGTTIATVRQVKDSAADVIKCYVPISTGKQIEPGMTVLIYPTTVSQQEYGHMEATVTSVDEYVSSTSSLLADLGVDSLVSSFSQSGPVIRVECTLRTDDSTASGYYWSSKKGASVTLSQSTMVTAEIVTERRHPITMLIPALKKWFADLGSSSQPAANAS